MNAQLWMQKIAEVAPDIHQALDETVPLVRESPFREEIVQELDSLFKHAEDFPMFQSTQGAAGAAGAATKVPFGQRAQGFGEAIGANVAQSVVHSLANDAFDAVKRGITKGWYYRKMLKNNPDLQKKDARMVKQVFSTLHRYNPEYTADPWVAGTWVRDHTNLATLGSIDIGTVNQIVGARKNIVDVKKMPVSQRMWQTPEEKQLEQLHIQKAQMEVSPHAQEMERLRRQEMEQKVDPETFQLRRRHLQQQTDEQMFQANQRLETQRGSKKTLGLERQQALLERDRSIQGLRGGAIKNRADMLQAMKSQDELAQHIGAGGGTPYNEPNSMFDLYNRLRSVPSKLKR
jgi:hypothetical protein